MRRAGPPGERFQYFTPATDLLGWILCRVHQQPYATLLAERLWSQIGAEHAGRIALDPLGVAVASGGLNVTARDLARFGQLLLDRGQRDGSQIVAPEIIEIIRAGGDRQAFARAPEVAHMEGWSYRAQWWIAPGGVVTAWGVNGQILWIDFDRHVVIARFASAPFSVDPERDVDEAAICEALVEHFGS
jgi:CubicO group peptidase (beta-lactamase class C family)